MITKIAKIVYFDCPTGLSGDMCLGALVDAGLPLAHLSQELARLGIEAEYHLRAEFVHRNGQQATKLHVELARPDFTEPSVTEPNRESSKSSLDHADHEHSHPKHSYHEHNDHPHSHAPAIGADLQVQQVSTAAPHPFPSRRLPEIEALIQASGLPERVIQQSLAIFQRLAEAEGAVHGIPPEQVHFHEVGATDAIVDIVGTCIGLDYLEIEQLYCSALPVGGGTVWAAHGRLPVPAPAVLKLWELRQVPLYSNGIERELVTPTGAAIVTVLASQFGTPPPMRLQKVGLGAGTKQLAIPNILRLWIGETDQAAQATPVLAGAILATANSQPQSHQSGSQQPPVQQPPAQQVIKQTVAEVTEQRATPQTQAVTVLETQIDDLNPQAIGYVMAELLAAGALDVFTQAIGMKKSRPGILLSVICTPEQADRYEAILFRETTTLGIRRSQQQRTALSRFLQAVSTPYGPVQVKVASQSGIVLNVQPEYEDCAQLAQRHQLPWREVHRLALQSWYDDAQYAEEK